MNENPDKSITTLNDYLDVANTENPIRLTDGLIYPHQVLKFRLKYTLA
jgi:hypothetical protein